MMSGFGGTAGSLNVFNLERPVYIRERLSKSYSTGAYFWGKSAAEVPFLLFYPVLMGCIVYWSVGMNTYDHTKFAIFVATGMSVWLAGSAMGLGLSTFIARAEVAMSVLPMVLIPFMLFSGFFVN